MIISVSIVPTTVPTLRYMKKKKPPRIRTTPRTGPVLTWLPKRSPHISGSTCTSIVFSGLISSTHKPITILPLLSSPFLTVQLTLSIKTRSNHALSPPHTHAHLSPKKKKGIIHVNIQFFFLVLYMFILDVFTYLSLCTCFRCNFCFRCKFSFFFF
jgi:hypothetical protein